MFFQFRFLHFSPLSFVFLDDARKNSLQKRTRQDCNNTSTIVVSMSTGILSENCTRLVLNMLRLFMKRSHSNENKIEINESFFVLMKLEQTSELKNARCLLRVCIMEI